MTTDFIDKMKALLGAEADSFFDALNDKPTSGLRCNRLKIEPEELCRLLDLPLSPIPWCKEGFYYPGDLGERRPSKSPLYQAGLYYLQEPSAMASVELLKPVPGDKVLDLCAAPGGKAAQIAGHLQNEGVLVANDASATRCKALVKNLTLCGVKNAVILKETPKRLAARFGGFFNKILVDAPCSGEGMFRRDPDAVKSWTVNKLDTCVLLQREILHHAASMLMPGGKMVYSTCTFNTSENEEIVVEFLRNHQEFEIEKIEIEKIETGPIGFAHGFFPFKEAVRLWPHKITGEGHFICLLRKKNRNSSSKLVRNNIFPGSKIKRAESPPALGAMDIPFIPNSFLHKYGTSVYQVPHGVPDLKGLRIARNGWHLGEEKKGRFEPSHSLALGLKRSEWPDVYDLNIKECMQYLRGESFEPKADFKNKSWVLMCIDGYPLGWARYVNTRLKNKYPQKWVV